MEEDLLPDRNVVIRLTIGSSIFILVCGLAFLVAGVFAFRWRVEDGGELVDLRHLDTSAAMQVMVGCLTLVLGKSALCTLRFGINWKRLAMLTVFLALVIILALCTGILAVHWRFKHSSELVENILHSIRFRYGQFAIYNLTDPEPSHDLEFLDENQVVTDRIDAAQEKLKCCGAVSPLDYGVSTWSRKLSKSNLTTEGIAVPLSCCPDTSPELGYCIYDLQNETDTVHLKGCAVLGKSFVIQASVSVILPTFILAIMLLAFMFFLVIAVDRVRIQDRRRSRTRSSDVYCFANSEPARLTSVYPTPSPTHSAPFTTTIDEENNPYDWDMAQNQFKIENKDFRKQYPKVQDSETLLEELPQTRFAEEGFDDKAITETHL